MQLTTTTDTLDLLAPLSGPVLAIENVPDPVFSQKIVGPGIAIDPTSTVLLAPCAGKIVQLHRAHHAISIETASGRQILLHVGLDTVKLEGQGFRPLVRLGEFVNAGQKLLEFDADLIAQRAKSLITVMVLTDLNEDQVSLSLPVPANVTVTAGRETVLRVGAPRTRAAAAAAASVKPTWAESPELLIENLPTGLHARPAALLANLAKTFHSQVQLIKNPRSNGPSGNAKSVVGIMGLEIAPGDRIIVCAEGSDAQAAAKGVFEFLKNLREKKTAVTVAPVAAGSARVSNDPNLLLGVGVSPGLAIGRIHQVKSESFRFEEVSLQSPEKEENLLTQARAKATEELKALMSKVHAKSEAAIFSAHQELLEDPDLVTAALALLRRGKTAAFAWNEAVNQSAERLASLNNELMANRANDLRDVGRRVLRLLTGGAAATAPLKENSILVAENLTPSETVQLDRTKVLGFCTTSGGATSHVAILARSLGLPAIAGIAARALEVAEGTEVVLDGEKGELILHPSSEQKAKAEREQRAQASHRQEAMKLSHEAARTADGHPIEVAANIGNVADAKQAVEMGADGVGLLRSEFLFLERDTAPTEAEQYQVYQEIADVLGARTLVIRTLDVGGDKPLKYLPLEPEENPFLGIRGVRIGLLYPEILRQQLRAILRVKSSGKLCVMFPMISTLEEFRAAKAILEEERAKLGTEAHPQLEVGIMVEVPSVALAADAFAREADFFSVGTNDLTQYTLAMDRGHKALAKQVDALHPSVLRLIQLAAEAAHRHGKWIGVCGGLASDLKAIPILIGLGIDELSVSIPSIPLVKSGVRETTLQQSKTLAGSAVQAETAVNVRNLITSTRN